MLTENIVFMSADDGRILSTSNGGINWNSTILPGSSDLFTIDFPVATTGYCAGSEGKIFRTSNSGASWNTVNSPTINPILSIKFINETTGFIAGGSSESGEIFKTTNAGVNWTQYGPGAAYPQIIFMNIASENVIYVYGQDALLMKSSNAGVNWTIQHTGITQGTFYSVYFTNENTGYASVPYPGHIVKTTNGGNNWNNIFNDTDYFPVTIEFTTDNTGYVAGADQTHCVVLKTTNAGSSWNTTVLDFDGHLNSVDFIGLNTGFIACDEGMIYKTTNGGTSVGIVNEAENIPEIFTLQQNYLNPFNPFTTIDFSLKENAIVEISIYDIKGMRIDQLTGKYYYAGEHSVEWNAIEQATGVYFYEMKVFRGGKVYGLRKKMVVLK